MYFRISKIRNFFAHFSELLKNRFTYSYTEFYLCPLEELSMLMSNTVKIINNVPYKF